MACTQALAGMGHQLLVFVDAGAQLHRYRARLERVDSAAAPLLEAVKRRGVA
ncbi:hypothetical protein [Streptomyces mirabilis]|uniref:hypothetical protein n=1 Tax=Streptomyces mirabilis TaxID=68239 RepID=UPI0036CC2E69